MERAVAVTLPVLPMSSVWLMEKVLAVLAVDDDSGVAICGGVPLASSLTPPLWFKHVSKR